MGQKLKMPIDFDKNFIFLHIPKTGGSSIISYLGIPKDHGHMFGSATVVRGRHASSWTGGPLVTPDSNSEETWLQHLTLGEILYISRFYIKIAPTFEQQTKILQNMFKFCFVRNPWDRAVSDYLWYKRLDEELSFEKFLSPWSSPSPWCHRRPQIDFAKDATFVGRYENLISDFKVVCYLLKIPWFRPWAPPGALIPENFPHEKKSDSRKHYSYYYNNTTKAMIETLYSRDIEFFNYKFEDLKNG